MAVKPVGKQKQYRTAASVAVLPQAIKANGEFSRQLLKSLRKQQLEASRRDALLL